MAEMKNMVPFIIKWECGIEIKLGESIESLYSRAKKSKFGFVNDPDDRGGATVLGVTFGAFENYMAKKGQKNVTVNDLKNLPCEDWIEILKKMYWNRWHADQIKNQSVAEILVDWVWGSGVHGIKIPQKMLGVTADGIVGVMTLDALNGKDPEEFFSAIQQERIAFYYGIVKRVPSQEKFLKGWINRTMDHVFVKQY